MSTPNTQINGRASASDPSEAQSVRKGRRITQKDLELLKTLANNEGKMRRTELVESQARANSYYIVALKRVYKLEEMGLVKFEALGPRGGIWAIMTDKGKQVVSEVVTIND